MAAGDGLRIDLAWDGEYRNVRAAAVAAGGRQASAAGWAPVRPGLLGTRREQPGLGRALLPVEVRALLVEVLRGLPTDQVLRIRLRLPRPSAAEGLPLGAYPWEGVLLPADSVHHRPDLWEAWAAEPDAVRRDGCEGLGRHPRFTLVREVAPDGPAPPAAPAATGRVVIANATAVRGPIRTPAERTVEAPGAGAIGDADVRSVEAGGGRSRRAPAGVPAPATADGILGSLPGALALYFGGHHVDGGLVVAAAPGTDRADWLDGDRLAGQLVDARVQLAVLMACDSAAAAGRDQRSLAEHLARAGVPYVLAVHGRVHDGQSADFAGGFFTAVEEGVEVDRALRRASRAFAGSEAVPVLYTSRPEADLHIERRPETAPSVLSGVAHRIPVGPSGGGAGAWPDERYRLHLETALCLAGDGGPEVLADPAGDDLVEPLGAAEHLLQSRRPSVDGRRWFAYESEGAQPPATASALFGKLSPRYRPRSGAAEADRGTGLVVRRRASLPTALDWPAYLAGLRACLPGLQAVVVQVHGEDPRAVVLAAERIADRLGRAEYLSRPAPPRPAAPPRSVAPLRGPGRRPARPAVVLRQLLEDERAVLDGAFDPDAVVADLNADGDRWGDPAEDAALLDAVRR
ncbi:CHAT domain-containing protein, partial [Kitasatospora sp. NPDC059571]|uniref:CHAT domain-containing protein n=1 Tax=Kitasatospora sp. NPDC059571 TaxID=3346871 RepID=UPI0036C05AB7